MNDRKTKDKLMQTIQPIETEHASAEAKRLLEAARAEYGRIPNMMRAMAQSPAALDGYFRFGDALSGGTLDPKLREQIALAVAQANGCEYSLAAHTALAARLGVTGDEILESREAWSNNKKTAAGLRFARDMVVKSGDGLGQDLQSLRQAGYSDGEIVEIIAHVALNIYANYFNMVAKTEIDFPRVALDVKAA
jgi:uncharacterized peroxidase-related enzyme